MGVPCGTHPSITSSSTRMSRSVHTLKWRRRRREHACSPSCAQEAISPQCARRVANSRASELTVAVWSGTEPVEGKDRGAGAGKHDRLANPRGAGVGVGAGEGEGEGDGVAAGDGAGREVARSREELEVGRPGMTETGDAMGPDCPTPAPVSTRRCQHRERPTPQEGEGGYASPPPTHNQHVRGDVKRSYVSGEWKQGGGGWC